MYRFYLNIFAIFNRIKIFVQGVIANVLNCGLKVHSHYYVHLETNTLGKGMNPLISPAMD